MTEVGLFLGLFLFVLFLFFVFVSVWKFRWLSLSDCNLFVCTCNLVCCFWWLLFSSYSS